MRRLPHITNERVRFMKINADAVPLSDEELENVAGGTAVPEDGRQVSLIGPYYNDSYANGSAHTRYIGQAGITIGRYMPGRPAPFEMKCRGVTFGWAAETSFVYKNE